MNGAEHYREAQALLGEASRSGPGAVADHYLAAAQVHATLAQVAATIGTGYARHDAVWSATLDADG